jgi:hypothetical protein
MSELLDVKNYQDTKMKWPRLFIMCDDCFWCASAIEIRSFDPDVCPLCEKPLASLPISFDEAYRYIRTERRGIELEFLSDRK